jgi:hypothetical protein
MFEYLTSFWRRVLTGERIVLGWEWMDYPPGHTENPAPAPRKAPRPGVPENPGSP